MWPVTQGWHVVKRENTDDVLAIACEIKGEMCDILSLIGWTTGEFRPEYQTERVVKSGSLSRGWHASCPARRGTNMTRSGIISNEIGPQRGTDNILSFYLQEGHPNADYHYVSHWTGALRGLITMLYLTSGRPRRCCCRFLLNIRAPEDR